MMFNGLLCGDSDTSDFSKESIGGFSVVDSGSGSGSGSCDTAARAHYYHNKLLSIMQILENKEETVRIQSESLSVAEARIATLAARVIDLKQEIDRKDRELQTLRKSIDSRMEKTDVSISTHFQEMDNQDNVVNTLQNNLSVIEDLYRESFYETVKQEGLIDMLRKSYLDIRLMDKEKSDQIGRLQSVINTQKCSIDQCQDIAMEVENLKLEISNFLNGSNNDSGVWDRSDVSVASGVGGRAGGERGERGAAAGCEGGVAGGELRDIAEHLLRLQEMLQGDCTCGLQEENTRLKHTNETMEIQINELHQKICGMESVMLDKDDIARRYRDQIEVKEKENSKIRHEVSQLRAQAAIIDTLYREEKEEREGKAGEAGEELRSQLQAARTRGSLLAEEARLAARALRDWARRARALTRNREETIEEKELLLRSLRERLRERRNVAARPSASESDAARSERDVQDVDGRCAFNSRQTRDRRAGTSGSEGAGRSSAPVPPRRMRKMPPCGDQGCGCFCASRNASVQHQRPERRDVILDAHTPTPMHTHACTHPPARTLSCCVHAPAPAPVPPPACALVPAPRRALSPTTPTPERASSHCDYHASRMRTCNIPEKHLQWRVEGLGEALQAARARARARRRHPTPHTPSHQ